MKTFNSKFALTTIAGLLLATGGGNVLAITAGVIGDNSETGFISDKENISGNIGIYAVGTKASAIAESISISSDSYAALYAYNGGRISVGGDSTKSVVITSTSDGINAVNLKRQGAAFVSVKASELISIVSDTYAIWGQNGTQQTQAPESHSTITIEAPSINIEGKDEAIVAFSNSEINIKGDATIKGGTNLIDTRGYASVNINRDNSNATTVLQGDIVFETPNVEGGDGNASGNLIDAFVNINLAGEGSSWTGRSYQMYSYKEDGASTSTTVISSEIGANREYFGQVSGLVLSVSNGATITTTGDSFANVLNMDSGNLDLADTSMFHVNDYAVTGDSNTINLGGGADINGTINDKGTLYLTGDTSSFTGALNVLGKASIGLTAEEASEALHSTDGSVLVVKAGSALNGTTAVGGSASVASSTGSSLSVLSDGTLAIVATDDYTEGTPLVTVGTASTESGSTVKLVNAVKIADGTTVFATTDDSAPSEYTLVTDNLLKVVENNQIVSQSASVALTGVLAPNTVNEALTASGLGAERVIALTTDTTADSAVKALNSIALMATAGAAQVVSVNASNMIADTLDQHGSLLASYTHDKSGADLWVDLNGSFSKASGYKAGSSSYGYKSDLAGATIGADYAFGNGVVAGAAFSIGTGSARGQGNGSGVKNDIDYWGVNFYGVWTTPYVNLIGNVGYLQTKNEISQSGYKGKPDVKTISVGVKAEKALQLNESITVTPHVGVRYFNVDMDSFTAGGFKYSSDKANLVQVPFGVAFNANLKASCGAKVKPFIDVQIAPAFGDRKATNKFALAGGSASDSIEARIANNAMYSAKVGVEATRGNHSFGLNYGIASGNYGRVDQALQAKYRYSF